MTTVWNWLRRAWQWICERPVRLVVGLAIWIGMIAIALRHRETEAAPASRPDRERDEARHEGASRAYEETADAARREAEAAEIDARPRVPAEPDVEVDVMSDQELAELLTKRGW